MLFSKRVLERFGTAACDLVQMDRVGLKGFPNYGFGMPRYGRLWPQMRPKVRGMGPKGPLSLKLGMLRYVTLKGSHISLSVSSTQCGVDEFRG